MNKVVFPAFNETKFFLSSLSHTFSFEYFPFKLLYIKLHPNNKDTMFIIIFFIDFGSMLFNGNSIPCMDIEIHFGNG